MEDPERLSDGEDLGAALLASARADAPSRASRKRSAAALGVAVGATLTTGAAGAGASGLAGGGAASSMGLVKVVALAAVGLSATAGLVVAARPTRSASPISTSVPAPNSSAPFLRDGAPSMPPPPASSDAPTLVVETPASSTIAPAIVPKSIRPRPLPAVTDDAPPPASSESAIVRELRSLDVAKAALERRDPDGALRALESYDRTFAAGATLQTEASVLRVEALLARGDTAEARRLATDMLARDPAGPHARRLRTIATEP